MGRWTKVAVVAGVVLLCCWGCTAWLTATKSVTFVNDTGQAVVFNDPSWGRRTCNGRMELSPGDRMSFEISRHRANCPLMWEASATCFTLEPDRVEPDQRVEVSRSAEVSAGIGIGCRGSMS